MTEQEKREKVIKGLECCVDVQSEWKDAVWVCPACPYAKNDGKPCETLAPLLDDAVALLKAQEPIEARLHLCESCAKKYPECDAMIDGIEFGSGVGNDNIIGCTAYVNRWKAQQPRVHGRWITNDDCGELECPICGGIQIEHGMFCTWCGAKLDGGAQDDD